MLLFIVCVLGGIGVVSLCSSLSVLQVRVFVEVWGERVGIARHRVGVTWKNNLLARATLTCLMHPRHTGSSSYDSTEGNLTVLKTLSVEIRQLFFKCILTFILLFLRERVYKL